ncbi:alcohol dehydrogenase catalytic domain-containing protein [Prescottella equi]|uniref:alcohol dehydrogenase catalytic domain-containing protein n=1 Tax=Rhodococcus hoagii TaxID=43767 RepID=UPI0009BCDFA5|nr:zinc-binding dehydrogenase [Prescottella equi]NKS80002.1 zinc-binding dehydrogenase [Prescottella equi]OQQ37335.1 alcohol dehydrogenase [Prescottella equi]ORL84345.1 alcohol dehydrogenase [Prescottella equi]ORM06320.1 alcohol dehydrogenase [Prescottella equi]WQB75250.1 zinc-binding dehydrogenase [Prescottella equi]
MRAVQFHRGEFTLADVADLPAPGPGQLRIDVMACGICGSDLSVSKDPCRFVDVVDAARYPLATFDHDRPVVLGHEYAGVVAEIGAGVTGFAVGDRVAGLGIVTDTSTGIPKIIGYSNTYHGGFGDQILVDAVWVRRIPDGLSFEHAALAEPLHVGELHMQRSGLTDLDSALVLGCGTIGLGAIVAAKARGAHTVIASEPSPKRRELALRMGADVVVDPSEDDPIKVWNRMVAGGHNDPERGGGGILIAYECSGRQGMLDMLLRNLPYDSRIQVLAAPFADETIIPVIGQLRRIAINFGHGPTERGYEIVLQRLASGEIDADAIITGRVDLGGVASAFDALRAPDDHVKIMVLPRGVASA